MYAFRLFLLCCLIITVLSEDKPRKKPKKDPIDFTENDVNKLFEEWEVIIFELNDIGIEIDLGK